MADSGVALPAPFPDDDEDVVWGLSTAAALWARGEHRDGVVWLRRAAEAADRADQAERAAELRAFAATLEADAGGAFDGGADEGSAAGVREPEAQPSRAPDGEASPSDSAGAGAPEAPAPGPSPLSAWLESDAAEPDSAAPVRAPADDTPTRPARRIGPSSVPPPLGPALAGAFVAPPAASAPPRSRLAGDPPAAARRPSRPPDAPLPRVRPRPRAPILDPWADDPFASERPPPPPPRALDHAQELHVPLRPGDESDDDVVTSAAPLAAALAPSRPAPRDPPAVRIRTLPLPQPAAAKSRSALRPPPADPAPKRADEAAAGRVGPVLRSDVPVKVPTPTPPFVFAPGDATEPGAPGEAAAAPAPKGGLALETVQGFADLPRETQVALARAARVERLGPDEEVAGFAVALVLEGEGAVCATIVDVPAHRAAPGTLIPTRGTLADGVALRVVAGAGGARVAAWDAPSVDDALRSCPWVRDELRGEADRLQALAGATMGPLGELEDLLRHRLLPKLSVRAVPPKGVVIEEGAALDQLVVVGAGVVTVQADRSTVARPGDLVLAREALAGAASPAKAAAGDGGALVLIADRDTTQEILAADPSLFDARTA